MTQYDETNWLLDDFCCEGTSAEELKKELEVFSGRTLCKDVKPYAVVLYSIAKTVKGGFFVMKMEPDYMSRATLFPFENESSYFDKENNNVGKISYERLERIGMSEEIISEIRERGYFIKIYSENGESEIIIPGKKLENSMAKKCGAGKLIDTPDPLREIYMAWVLSEAEDDFSLLMRKNLTYSKAFFAFAKGHRPIQQDKVFEEIFTEILEKYPEASVKSYRITHNLTQVLINTSNEEGTFKPAFVLKMCDVGEVTSCLSSVVTIDGDILHLGRKVEDLKNVDTFLKKEQKLFEETRRHIASYDSRTRNMSDRIMLLARSIDLTSIGKKYFTAYEAYVKETFAEQEGTEEDAIRELLNIRINLLEIVRKYSKTDFEKEIPQYIFEKIEDRLGRLF